MFSMSQFLSYVAVVDLTPGPNTVTAMSNGIRFSLKGTVPFLCGLFFCQALIMALAGCFSAFLFQYLPWVKPFMQVVGAAYMLFLAYKIYRSGSVGQQEGPAQPISFWGGALIQFLNPKMLLFALTSMSVYILPHFHTLPAIAAKAIIIPIGGVISCTLWASFGALLCGFYNRHTKAVNLLMALALVYCAVALFL